MYILKNPFFSSLDQKLNQYSKILLFFTITLLVLWAWFNRFLLDDAFISFRYAENFYDGFGLKWNKDDIPLEGYTNFLWVLLSTLGFSFKNIIIFTHIVSIAFFGINLFIIYLLSKILLENISLAFFTTILVGSNFTFNSYATGGLETSLNACLTTSVLYLLTKYIKDNAFTSYSNLGISFLLALSFLTRPDNCILAVISSSILLYSSYKNGKLIDFFLFLIPLSTVLIVWGLWKIYYYGDIFPNTFYIKGGNFEWMRLIRGIGYIIFFMICYGIIFILPFIFIKINLLKKKLDINWLPCLSFLILWFIYIIYIGGDIFEFRFLVNIIPIVYIFVFFCLFNFYSYSITYSVLCFLFFFSLFYGLFGYYLSIKKVLPHFIGNIKAFNYNTNDWIKIGKVLSELSKEDNNITISTTAAGAIPFYSKLKTIDMLGLNNKMPSNVIKRENCIVCLGHQKIVPIKYLLEKNVNLLIGHPQIINKNEFDENKMEKYLYYMYLNENSDVENLPKDSKLLLIPIKEEQYFLALYIKENSLIDKEISNKKMLAFDFFHK